MGDFRQRIGLVHKLRQLRRPEELTHRCRYRLGVNQILRHHRINIDRAHALFNGTLHAQQADAVLIFHQLTDRTHTAIAKIVNIINIATSVAQIDECFHNADNIFFAQHTNIIRAFLIEADIHFHPTDG